MNMNHVSNALYPMLRATLLLTARITIAGSIILIFSTL